MNVLWLAPYPHPVRRVRTHQAPWMTTLAQRVANVPDIRLTIVSVSAAIPQTERFTHEGIDYIYVKVPVDKYDLLTGYQQRIRRVQRVLAQLNIAIDIIHIHGSELQYQVMASKLSAPKVLSVQGIMSAYIKTLPNRFDYRHLSWRVAEYYERKYLPTIRHFICRTHWDTALTRAQSAQSTIHQNWEMMRDVFYTAIEPAVNPTKLLYVGGINTVKGIRQLLIMFDRLIQHEPLLRLSVAGTGCKQDLMALVAQLNLTNIQPKQIDHAGFLNAQQLWEAYHDALCLVHPSHIDNSPNSICEAQLAGLPVVATNVGGVSSLIEHNRTGLLTPLDPIAIADAVRQLYNQPDARREISRAARIEALKRHDSATIVETTCSIYSSVISGKAAPTAHVLI